MGQNYGGLWCVREPLEVCIVWTMCCSIHATEMFTLTRAPVVGVVLIVVIFYFIGGDVVKTNPVLV